MSIGCQGNYLKMIHYFVRQGPFVEAVSRSAKIDVSRTYVIGFFISLPQDAKLDFLVNQLNSDHNVTL